MYTLARNPRYDPFAELDRLFDGFRVAPAAAGAFAPALDVTETDDAYAVRLEIPGVAPADVTVTLEDGQLTVAGEKKAETEQNGRTHRTERTYGKFTRSVQFPAAIAADDVTAVHAHGVLTVRLPKDAKSRARTVQVKSE